jgi:hypothetical protein
MADKLLPTAIRLTCTAGKVNGSHKRADEKFTYVIQNDFLTDWVISLHMKPGENLDFHRHATADRPLFDDKAFTFMNEPMSEVALGEIFSQRAAIPAHMTMKIRYKKFSRFLLEYMTRNVDDLRNLADPDPKEKDAILKSFVEKPGSRARDFSFPDEVKEIKDIPCHLDSPNAIGNLGAVLTFHLDLIKLSDNDRKNVMLALMSADHSKLIDLGVETASGELKKRLDVWVNNIISFMVNFTNLDRSQKILDNIVDLAKDSFSKDPSLQTAFSVVSNVREGIDNKMITANHWADDRENEPGEEYQFALSNVLGSILHSKKFASLVMLVRGIDEDMAKPQKGVTDLARKRALELEERKDWAFYILQSGVGHCGEHANVSFMVLRELMLSTQPKSPQIKDVLKHIVLSGNANIQHDFVIGGMRPSSKINATGRLENTLRPKVKKGEKLDVLDLNKMLTEHPGEDGFVCDPYLSKKAMGFSLRALLKKINDPNRGARRTVAVGCSLVHPDQPDVPIEFGRKEIDGV